MQDKTEDLLLKRTGDPVVQEIVNTRNAADIEAKRAHLNKALANFLPPEQREKVLQQVLGEVDAEGAIVSNPSAIGEQTVEQVPSANLPEQPQIVVTQRGRPSYAGGQKQKPKNCKAACLGLLAVIRDLCLSQTSTNRFTSAEAEAPAKPKSCTRSSSEINRFPKASKLLRTIELKTALRRKGFTTQTTQTRQEYVVKDTLVWRKGSRVSGDVVRRHAQAVALAKRLPATKSREGEKEELEMYIKSIAGDTTSMWPSAMKCSSQWTQSKQLLTACQKEPWCELLACLPISWTLATT